MTPSAEVPKDPEQYPPDPRKQLVKYYELYAPVRAQELAFYERLILLITGTVALVMTAVIGGVHSHQIRHRYSLQAGLGCLVFSVIALLARNFTAMRHEKRIRDALGSLVVFQSHGTEVVKNMNRVASADNVLSWFAAIGVLLMLTGFFLILYVITTMV